MRTTRICALHNCTTVVPYDRTVRRLVTCCPGHSEKHRKNSMVIARAKKIGKTPSFCSTPGCDRAFLHMQDVETTCTFCRGMRLGAGQRGRSTKDKYPSPKYEAITGGGKHHRDSRSTVCHPNGKVCDNYSECLEAAYYAKGGKMRCDIDPGSCEYVHTPKKVRVSFGCALAREI